MASNGVQRTSIQLYRDCLRLVNHVAPGKASPKNMALRMTVRNEFRNNRNLSVAEDVETAKASAVRALSNYMLAVSAPQDAKLASSMKDFHGRSVQEAKDAQAIRASEDSPSKPRLLWLRLHNCLTYHLAERGIDTMAIHDLDCH